AGPPPPPPPFWPRARPPGEVVGVGLGAVRAHRRWTEEHGEHALRLQDTGAPLLDGPGCRGR
ncbi:MAG: hypothetical protein L0J57_08390, partial [Brachybacterium sp.]|nr:hypothetical protein [Brachybacterium sp.]